MAVRTPLYETGGNLREMSSSMIDQIKAKAIYLYSQSPSVTLSYVSSGGSLGTIQDTRYFAGSSITRTDRFATEAETSEPTLSTVSYSRITQSLASASQPADTSNIAFPLYYTSGGQLQAMTQADMLDTFIEPALTTISSGSTGTSQGGTYFVSTSNSVSGAALVNANPVFTDTKADVAAYTSGGIPENTQQVTTVANYYLHQINGTDASYTSPVYARSDSNIQVFTTSNFNTILQNYMRWAAVNHTGYRISYNYDGSGNTRGTFTNTVLTGVTGNYQQRFVNTDDYRAQEFPNGTETTNNIAFKINLS
jgi:hypothetical protein